MHEGGSHLVGFRLLRALQTFPEAVTIFNKVYAVSEGFFASGNAVSLLVEVFAVRWCAARMDLAALN
jgi:hypothetical protein